MYIYDFFFFNFKFRKKYTICMVQFAYVYREIYFYMNVWVKEAIQRQYFGRSDIEISNIAIKRAASLPIQFEKCIFNI